MLDRRRIIAIAIGAVVVIAIIITAIALVVSKQSDAPPADERPVAETTPNATPTTDGSAPADESAAAIDTFESDYFEMVRSAAIVATSWNGLTDNDLRVARYKQAGIADSLAESYMPVWADVFGPDNTAEITTTVDSNLRVDQVQGVEGSYTWRIAATVTFKGTWHEDGATRTQSPRSAVWWFTVDQATNQITAIDQPAADELQINTNKKD